MSDKTTFKLDPEGNEKLLRGLARGFAELGELAADRISALAPVNTGKYAGSIQATTFLDGQIVSGFPVRGKGVQHTAQIWTVVYTTNKLGHLLELGTKERTVTAKGKRMSWAPDKYGPGGSAMVVNQRGTRRYPHFWPGLASVLGRVGQVIGHGARLGGGSVNARVL